MTLPRGFRWLSAVFQLFVPAAWSACTQRCLQNPATTQCNVVSDTTTSNFMAFFPGQPGWAGTRKVNHSGFYWSKRWRGGSGISWTICKSFVTTPVPHHSVFTCRMPLLPPNQRRQSNIRFMIININLCKITAGTSTALCVVTLSTSFSHLHFNVQFPVESGLANSASVSFLHLWGMVEVGTG